MNLSTRGRYAVMAMLDLAQMASAQAETGAVRPITLAQIAERQRISLSYLEQLFAQLRKAGVVESARGPGGGYTLAHPAEETYLASIIAAVDEEIDLTRCGGHTNPAAPLPGHGCVGGKKCNAHDLWAALSNHMENYLKRVTLAMVLDGDLNPDADVFAEPRRVPSVRIMGDA
jgi:Rrf2 family iron-sulfur cluster assembly transcriptional regulator